jgi:transposase-like protein
MTTTVGAVGEGRRRWTVAEKARIAEESLVSSASATGVARRYDINPSVIYAWRRQLRSGELRAAGNDRVQFVPVAVSTGRETPAVSVDCVGSGSAIEVALRNGRILRVPDGVVPARAGALADALEGIGR